LVNTPFHHGIENASGPQSLCVSCNACQTVCPVDIPLPRQILDTRAWAARAEGSRLPVRIAIETWSRGNLLRLLARFGSVAQKPMRRGDFVSPPGLSSLSSWRSLPALADRPFRRVWKSDSPSLCVPGIGRPLAGIRVAYFVQCLTDLLYPDMGLAIVDVLRGLGATVLFPRSQHCCGLPAIDAGLPEHAKKMARHTVRTLESCEADWIVSGGTSCIIAFQHDYEHLFQGEPEWQERASAIAEKSRDFTSFLRKFAHLPSGSLAGPMTEKATYHYFCQSYNVLGWRTEPLEFLSDVCGIDLVPLQEANVCCGFGGSVSLTRPEMCAHILKRKLENVDETGTGLLITDNPGCIMHLRGGINASRRQVKVMHTAEIVAGQVRSLCR
jgi:L-lactate dehydrogenase complex protein LldF